MIQKFECQLSCLSAQAKHSKRSRNLDSRSVWSRGIRCQNRTARRIATKSMFRVAVKQCQGIFTWPLMVYLKFKCCGAIDYQDWKLSKYVNDSAQNEETLKKYNRVAESCCKTPSKLCAARDHPSNINYRVSLVQVLNVLHLVPKRSNFHSPFLQGLHVLSGRVHLTPHTATRRGGM